MAASVIPERVLVTAGSLDIFGESHNTNPCDIPDEYRLIWRKPITAEEDEQGNIRVTVLSDAGNSGVQDRIQFVLGDNAWFTPREATDALVKRLAEDTRWSFGVTDDCTALIAKVHGDTDFFLRESGLSCTLSRFISMLEGRMAQKLGYVSRHYSELLHQQCDLEHELQRREQGLIKED